MSKTALNRKDKETNKHSGENETNNAYSLVENILEELEIYELEQDQVSIDVETEMSSDSLEIEYQIETLEWYNSNSEIGLGKEPVSFTSSYSVETETLASGYEIASVLEDNFDGSAIRVNGELVQKSPSPEYNAF
jgi:hypothetical protein